MLLSSLSFSLSLYIYIYTFPIMSLQSPIKETNDRNHTPQHRVSQDFIDLFDTLPPGSDEIVALTEVLEKVKDPLTGREKLGFQWPL